MFCSWRSPQCCQAQDKEGCSSFASGIPSRIRIQRPPALDIEAGPRGHTGETPMLLWTDCRADLFIPPDRVSVLWRSKHSMLDASKKMVDFLQSGSSVKQCERIHLGKVRLRRVEPVTHRLGITEDIKSMLVKHRQMVESIRFLWSEFAFSAATAKRPGINPDDVRERASGSAKAFRQIIEPSNLEAFSDECPHGDGIIHRLSDSAVEAGFHLCTIDKWLIFARQMSLGWAEGSFNCLGRTQESGVAGVTEYASNVLVRKS